MCGDSFMIRNSVIQKEAFYLSLQRQIVVNIGRHVGFEEELNKHQRFLFGISVMDRVLNDFLHRNKNIVRRRTVLMAMTTLKCLLFK
jgi:hypothetical protein